MALNFKRLWDGIQVKPRTSTAADTKGELEVIDSTGKLQLHNGTSVSPVVTESHASQGANRLQNKDLEANTTKIVDSSDTAKKVSVDVSGATTATTTTLDFNQTANRTVTIPDATDTLVARDTTDTLTNKTLTSPVVNNADLSLDDVGTAFSLNVDSVSGLSTNRTLTVDVNDADRTIDLSGNLIVSTAVTLDGTEVKGPASAVNEAIVRFDGTTGKLVKSGTGTITAAGAVAGLTELTVDNVNINGTTITSSTGSLTLSASSDQITVLKGIHANYFLRFENASVATTGAISALSPGDRSFITLTGAGAVTLQGIIAGQGGYTLYILNLTGNDLTIANESGSATAGNRILTGTGADTTVSDDSVALLQYSSVDSRWHLVAGGAGGGGGGYEVASDENISASGTITLTADIQQYHPVQGNAAAVTASTTPFGASPPVDGTVIVLEGLHDTNTVTILNNDNSNGAILNGDMVLYKYSTLTLVYRSGISRYVEVSRTE